MPQNQRELRDELLPPSATNLLQDPDKKRYLLLRFRALPEQVVIPAVQGYEVHEFRFAKGLTMTKVL